MVLKHGAACRSGLNSPGGFMQLHTSPVVPQVFFCLFVSFPHFFDVNSHGYSND